MFKLNGYFPIFLCLLTLVSLKVNELSRFQAYFNTLKQINGQVTNTKITFEYNENKGFYCKADGKIDDYEITFILPKEGVICSNFIFPYINELALSIDTKVDIYWQGIINTDFIDKNELKKVLLFAYSLNFFIKFPQIKENIKPYMTFDFKHSVSRQMLQYLNLLPENTENFFEFNSDHFMLLKSYSSFPINYKNLITNIVDSIEEHFESHSAKEFFKNWLINSKENLLHLIASVMQRGIKIKKELFNLLYPNYRSDFERVNLKNSTVLFDINFRDDNVFCFLNYVDMCNFPSISSKSIEDDNIIRIDYYSGNLLIYNNQQKSSGDEYTLLYERNLNNYQLLLRYGFSDSTTLNAFEKIYINIPNSFNLSQTYKINHFLKKLDNNYNKNYTVEFGQIRKAVPFFITNNEENSPHLVELIKILNDYNNDNKIDELFKIYSTAERVLLENQKINKDYSSMINNKNTSQISSSPYFISLPEIRDLINLSQKVSNLKRNHKDNNLNYQKLKITEKILKFIKDQRMIFYRNRMYNYNGFLSLTRNQIKSLKKHYIKTS